MLKKTDLGKCKKLLDSSLSLVCIGNNKIPNFPWKLRQTQPYTKEQFEKDYLYSGGIIKKNGVEIDPTNGVGIVTGYNGIEVFDIDLKIFASLKEQQDFWHEYITFLRDNINDFDDKFVIYKTVNNGYHIIYRCAKIGGNEKVAKLKGHNEAIIETRGIGGYVFIYENQVSKKSYYEIQEISELDRDVLFSVSKFYNYIEEKDQVIPKEQSEVINNETEITTWVDYNNKTNIIDVLGNEFSIIRNLSDKYVIKRDGAKSPHSGYIYKNSGCMYLFSTGTIYPAEKLLSPFSVYTYKFHNGNFSEAAKDLYQKGFGSRMIKPVQELSQKIIIKQEDLVFPIDIFPQEIQAYMILCQKTLDSSIDYMGCSFLWVLSIITGNAVKCQVKTGWIENSTVWFSVVGKAGIGKTPSIANIIDPLQKVNSREQKKYIKQNEKYIEYMELDKKDRANTEEIKKPRKTQFIANDITLEALVDLHEENKNAIGLFKDELAGWFKDMNKYRAGSDLEFWLSTWSGKSVFLNRKTAKSSFVESPLISVLGGIQPGVLDSFYTEENKDNGFIDRMLLCFPDLTVEEYNENELNPGILTWYSDYVISFYDIIKAKALKFNNDDEIEPILAKFSSDAKKEWKRIFNDITNQQNSDDENEYMKSMLPKQKSYIPRFALLINTLKWYDTSEYNDLNVITKESILAAEKLSKYFIAMSKKIKINSAEVNDIKKYIRNNDSKTSYEKFKELYKINPEINKSELAEKLGISRKTLYQYIAKSVT
jgi:hypothetical protein